MTKTTIPASITVDEFHAILSRYPDVLKKVSDNKQPKNPTADSKSLVEIDNWRDGVPNLIKEDKGEGGTEGRHLDASTVKEIVAWKLKRGKFRPTIMPLVNSNSETELESIVQKALSKQLPAPQPAASTSSSKSEQGDADALAKVVEMTKILTKLKGIGEATASAVLSSVFPETIPMFSDEAFRWIMMDSTGKSGWDRKIAYNAKEYATFFLEVRKLSRRLGAEGSGLANAGTVEKVGWVLGQEAALGIKSSSQGSASTVKTEKVEDEDSLADTKLSETKTSKTSKAKLPANSKIKSETMDQPASEKPKTGALSKTTAKRKEKPGEISPPPLRRSKRNRDDSST